MTDAVTTIMSIIKFFLILIVRSVVAFLPKGVLPRKSVKDKIILITGGGSGIGRQMAIEFAKLGAIIIVWDINQKGNEETKKIVESNDGKIFAYTVDITKKQEIYDTAAKVKSDIGVVDILINNAGIVSGKLLMDISDKNIEKTFCVNTLSHFFTTKAFLPDMFERNDGHIVNIASVAGTCGIAYLTDYCSSKYAALGFHDALTAEIGFLKKDIKTTVVCPYFINTGMFDGYKSINSSLITDLTPEYVVECILEGVLTNQYMVAIPKSSYFVGLLNRILPTEAILMINDHTHISEAMSEFKGSHTLKR